MSYFLQGLGWGFGVFLAALGFTIPIVILVAVITYFDEKK